MRLPQVLIACLFGGLAFGSPADQGPVIVIQGADRSRTVELGETPSPQQIAISGNGASGIVVREQEFSNEPFDGPDPWQQDDRSATHSWTDAAGPNRNTSFSTGFRYRGNLRYNPGLRHQGRAYSYHPGTRNRGNFPNMRNLNMRGRLGGGSSIKYGSQMDYGRSINYQRGRRFKSDIKYGFR